MLKRFAGLALAAGMLLASPIATFARDSDRGHDRGYARQSFRNDERREWREHDRDRGRFGFGIYSAPPVVAAPANGYYDQYGVWHPYGYYDRYGVWRQY